MTACLISDARVILFCMGFSSFWNVSRLTLLHPIITEVCLNLGFSLSVSLSVEIPSSGSVHVRECAFLALICVNISLGIVMLRPENASELLFHWLFPI